MYEKFFKRVIDFALSLTALIVLSPILLILTIVGAVVMGGNPFFTQMRPGKISNATGKEKIFKLVKFRTMSNKKDDAGNLLPDEIRLNKYGKLLRSTSLDELPELWNILKGDMSIVGPRPLLVSYLPYYTKEERRRHDIRPGLTGLAQVSGRNMVSWEKRFEIDVDYRDNITFLNDVKIIIKTVKSVLSRKDIALNAMEDFDKYRRRQMQEENSAVSIVIKE